RDSAVAGFAEFARAGRVAGCDALGSSSGNGGIGGVDHRDEKHPIGFVLPVINPVLCQVSKSKGLRRTKRIWLGICLNLALRRSGHGQQVVHGGSAGSSLLVCLVDRWAVALAQLGNSGSHPYNGNRCQCRIAMDARVATCERRWSTIGADLAGTLGSSGSCGLVLSRQTDMAASIDHNLSALADRCRAVGFVFGAASDDRHFIHFLAQPSVLVSRLFLCFCLFPGVLAA